MVQIAALLPPSAGVVEQLRLAVLAAYDQLFGLELEQRRWTAAPPRHPAAVGPPAQPGRPPQAGLKRSMVVEAGGLPWAWPRLTTATAGCWRQRWTP